MSYELGNILSFNNSEWGLLEYKSSRLAVYSITEKRKYVFTLPSDTFKALYSKSTEISQERIDFALDEANRLTKLKKKLRPGVKFIGIDDKEYTFMRFNRNKMEHYSRDIDYIATIEFIKYLTGDIDESYVSRLEPVTSKKEFNALSDEDKVKTALNSFKDYTKHKSDEVEILDIGNIISGYAYYHEIDDYYELYGLQVKFKDKFGSTVGFFPIYIGKAKDSYPISFDDSFSKIPFDEHRYENGLGDKFTVDKILIPKRKLSKIKF